MLTLFSPDNRLIQLARAGQLRFKFLPDKLYPWLALLFSLFAPILAGLCVIPIVTIYILLGNLDQLVKTETSLDLLLTLVFSFLPLYFVLWAWLWVFEKRHLWTVGLEAPGAVFKYLRGVAIGFIMFTVSIGLFAALGYAAFEDNPAQTQGVAALGGVALVFVGWFVQGAAEEVLTRGFLMPILSARYGTLFGIGLSAGVFAALHLLNEHVDWLPILNLFLFGVFASLYALYEGGLWGICAIHSVWNWVQGNFYGFEVSGSSAGATTLINLQETGPDWLTGGAFGPEGGLAVTLVLLIACGLVWWAGVRREKQQGASAAPLS